MHLGDVVVSYLRERGQRMPQRAGDAAGRFPRPATLPGSYSDWAGTGMPIATGDQPGDHPPGLGALTLLDGRLRECRRQRCREPIARSPSSATWKPNSDTSGPTLNPSRCPTR